VGADFAARYPLQGQLARPRWLRRLLRRPAGPCAVWQVWDRAAVPGICGPVDLDVLAA
jgi:hypothetical protein